MSQRRAAAVERVGGLGVCRKEVACGEVRKARKQGFQLREEWVGAQMKLCRPLPSSVFPSAFTDNTACRPPDPGYSWSHSWLDGENTWVSFQSLAAFPAPTPAHSSFLPTARAAETEAARHSLPHLHLLLWLLLPIQVWDLLQDIVSLPSRPPALPYLFLPPSNTL